MLPGFNHNIRHRDVLFHVQSEDSGRDHPHVITHLYHGGTILASEKSSYAERLDTPDLPVLVRQLMETQHKAVLKRLRDGEFDPLIVERLGAAIFRDASDSGSVTQPALPEPGLSPEAKPPEPEPASLPAPPPAPGSAEPEPRSFGEGIVSQRPLDEVILKYLVENARKRKHRSS